MSESKGSSRKRSRRSRKGSKGTRSQVYWGKREVTDGGLRQEHLFQNKRGTIVPLSRHNIGLARQSNIMPFRDQGPNYGKSRSKRRENRLAREQASAS